MSADESDSLPPMLSPTLPSEWNDEDFQELCLMSELTSQSPVADSGSRLVSLKYDKAKPLGDNTSNPTKLSKAQPETGTKTSAGPISSTTNAKTLAIAGRESSTINDARATDKCSVSTGSKSGASYRQMRDMIYKWAKNARDLKHEADVAIHDNKMKEAALLSLDAVVCFIVAFTYEDRSDVLARRTIYGRSWKTLVPYLQKSASFFKTVDPEVAGLCYQVTAVLEMYLYELSRKIVNAENDSFEYLVASISDFKRGLAALPANVLHSKYLIPWEERPAKNGAKLKNKFHPRIPLHINSTMEEAAAVALHVMREWAKLSDIEYAFKAEEYEKIT